MTRMPSISLRNAIRTDVAPQLGKTPNTALAVSEALSKAQGAFLGKRFFPAEQIVIRGDKIHLGANSAEALHDSRLPQRTGGH